MMLESSIRGTGVAKKLDSCDAAMGNFVPGQLYEYEGTLVRFVSCDNDAVTLSDVFSRRHWEITSSEFESVKTFQRDAIERVSKEAWERGLRISRMLEEILRRNVTSPKGLDHIATEFGVDLKHRQIQRLLKRYRANRTTFSVTAQKKGRKKGGRLLGNRTELGITKALTKVDAIKEGLNFTKVAAMVEEECKKLDAKPPSTTALKSRLRDSGFSLRRRRSVGPTLDSSNSKVFLGENKVSAPLAQVQIDHTKVDLRVVDEDGVVVFRRPWLTLVIDIYSRVVLGFFLSIKAPSIHAVSRALIMACLPKEELLEAIGINLEWPTYGKPQVCHTDNGAEFKSAAYLRGCGNQGITPVNRPVGRKEWGGHVERVIGRTMGQIHLLPGTTFSNSKQRGHYDSAENASLTMPELAQWILFNIVEYNNTVHRKLDESPFHRWKRYWASAGGQKIEHKVRNVSKFYFDFLEELNVHLQKDGVHWGTKTYRAGPLKRFKVGTPLTVKVDRTNTREIFLVEKDGTVIPLQRCTEAKYDDFQLEAEHRRMMRMRSENAHSIAQRTAAKAGQSQIEQKAKERRDRRVRAKSQDVIPVPSEIRSIRSPPAQHKMPEDKALSLGAGSFVKPKTIRTVSAR